MGIRENERNIDEWRAIRLYSKKSARKRKKQKRKEANQTTTRKGRGDVLEGEALELPVAQKIQKHKNTKRVAKEG